MSDKQVVAAGKSAEEVAARMAELILISIESKSWADISRKEYLQAVYESLLVLRGVSPKTF